MAHLALLAVAVLASLSMQPPRALAVLTRRPTTTPQPAQPLRPAEGPLPEAADKGEDYRKSSRFPIDLR